MKGKNILKITAFIGLILTLIWGNTLFTESNQSITPDPPKDIPKATIDGNLDKQDTIIYNVNDTSDLNNPCPNYQDNSDGYPIIDKEFDNIKDSIDILSAIIFVESCDNDSAYRASEDAVGCLQIRKTMVNDINRILKRQKSTLRFTYNDRWSRDKSIQMFKIYCKHYGLTTAEEIARCWNGGPRGINNPSTVGYWKKVKDKINS